MSAPPSNAPTTPAGRSVREPDPAICMPPNPAATIIKSAPAHDAQVHHGPLVPVQSEDRSGDKEAERDREATEENCCPGCHAPV